MGINNLSKIILGIGVTLSVASVLSIYITSLASQNQSPSAGQQSVSTSSPSSSQVSTPSVTTNISNSAPANTTATTTAITIPQGASTQQVSQYYLPVNASIPKNASITWTNKDIAPHTATASDGSFDTGIINVGSTGSASVKGQGDIQYHCTIHPWMHGSLQVSG